MQAVVLVGGEGTRLRPLTADVPKPALTLVDRPFLAYMVEWLASHGVDEVVLACGFLRFHMIYRFQQRSKEAFAQTASEACEAISSIRTVAALARESDVMVRYDGTQTIQQRASIRSILFSSAIEHRCG